MKKTLSSLIIKSLELNQSKKIIGKKINNSWTWTNKKKVLGSIQYCQDYLKSEKITRGDRVAYKGANSVEWLAWNIACNSLGGVWVPMYDNQSDSYCDYIVNDCNPSVLISDSPTNSKINVKILDNTIYPDLDVSHISCEHNELSTLIYTSGTTGNPKGVMLSNENIISNIHAIRSRFQDMQETTSLNILPWAHIYSQTCELYYNVLYDNKMALCSSREDFVNELKEIQPDVLYLVPRVLELIKSKTDFLDVPILHNIMPLLLRRVFGKNVKVIFVGGARLQPHVKEYFHKYGYTLCEGYGCTELAPMVCVNHMNDPRNEDSIGKILDNVLVEIVNNEIQVSGPNVMMGYWNQEEASKEVLVERDNKTWYKTGDGGYMEDGYLYYTGRNNDNYKLSNGKFVNVDYVESIVKKHVKCHCVVFTQDNVNNELIISQEITQEFLDFINKELPKYLKIYQTHWLKENEWDDYLTPKMSVKRKKLIQNFMDKKIDLIMLED